MPGAAPRGVQSGQGRERRVRGAQQQLFESGGGAGAFAGGRVQVPQRGARPPLDRRPHSLPHVPVRTTRRVQALVVQSGHRVGLVVGGGDTAPGRGLDLPPRGAPAGGVKGNQEDRVGSGERPAGANSPSTAAKVVVAAHRIGVAETEQFAHGARFVCSPAVRGDALAQRIGYIRRKGDQGPRPGGPGGKSCAPESIRFRRLIRGPQPSTARGCVQRSDRHPRLTATPLPGVRPRLQDPSTARSTAVRECFGVEPP